MEDTATKAISHHLSNGFMKQKLFQINLNRYERGENECTDTVDTDAALAEAMAAADTEALC